ncbi:MAG: nucleotide exchange factor GrpE [Chloroflexota bacterium]
MSDTLPEEQANEAEPNQQRTVDAPSAEDTKPVHSNSTEAASNAAPTDSQEASIEMQLAGAQAKAAEYLDGWQRSRADFVNYRKRAEKEREEVYQNASVDTLRKLLPVIDDFDRAIANVPANKANDEVIKGFGLIHRKLVTLLENTGITVINPIGEEFNPEHHEAIGQDESSDVPSGHVTAVLQKGYIHGDKMLRPAIVRVAS